MVQQRVDAEKSNSPRLIYCPHTGEQMASQSWKEFAIPNGRVFWWHCTACGGWHILIDGPQQESAPHNPNDPNDSMNLAVCL